MLSPSGFAEIPSPDRAQRVYSDKVFPRVKRQPVRVSSLAGRYLVRLVLDGSNHVVAEERLLNLCVANCLSVVKSSHRNLRKSEPVAGGLILGQVQACAIMHCDSFGRR